MVEFGKNGIIIDGNEIPFYSGSVHYWRSARKDWGKILDHTKALGFDIIETYLPWRVHEPEEGRYDFGETDERKDVNAFLELCREKDLWVIVRPGPHINSEMTCFGYPDWILADPEIQARTPGGTPVVYPHVAQPFAIPSYASCRLFEKTEEYFHALTPLLRKHRYPYGKIIAIQAENETCYFFRDRPYVMDYSKDSILLYQKMLEEKYGKPEALAEAYGVPAGEFRSVMPPKKYDENAGYGLEYYYDWAEYKEYQILYALERMADMIGKMELEIPVFHNCAYQTYTPVSVQRIEQIPGISVAGIDAYPEPGDTDMLKHRVRYLAGSSRLPFIPEFGSGSWFDRGEVLTAEEEEFGYLYAFMNGMKAVNFYMLAERDRWTGCPLTNDGSVRREYGALFERMTAMLKRERVYCYTRRPQALILKNYDMGRLKSCLSGLDPNTLSANILVKGPDIPWQLFAKEGPEGTEVDRAEDSYEEEWILRISGLLDSLQIEYDISDCYIDRANMQQYSYVFASSYQQMDREYQELLADYARGAGHQLWIGPTMPEEDRRGRSCLILKEAAEAGAAVACAEEIGADDLYPLQEWAVYRTDSRHMELSVHSCEEEHADILWLANRWHEAAEAKIEFSGSRRFRGIWNSHNIEGTGSITVRMPPYTVAAWKVEGQGDD